MPAFRSKVFVCPGCKKMISYSQDQAGTVIACPRCGEQVTLTPQANAEEPPPLDAALPPPLPMPPKSKKSCGRACLFLGCGGCLTVLLLLVGLVVLLGTLPFVVPRQLQPVCKRLVSHGFLPGAAHTPTSLGSTDIDVTVVGMKRGCPRIYQAALNQTSATETPIYCVTVEIANTGSTPVTYRTWRRMESENDVQRAATLIDGKGTPHGTVSFGPETWPEGAVQQTVIPPGGAVTDTLLFECGTRVPGDFVLTLPGENLGTHGRLSFRIADETPPTL
jgi:DNA-directed RNA polymerase subunit RPC12/RpoP